MKRKARTEPSKPSPAIERPGARATVLAAIVSAFGVAAHLPAVRAGFFSDDFSVLVDNPKLASIPLLEAWRLFAERLSPWDYLPIRDLSYRIELALFGLAPLGFHVVNVILFALTCVGAFLATRSVLRVLRGVRGDAFEDSAVVVATALFAVHPAHVESVAWIASRKDLLSGLFALACTWRFAEAISDERPSWRGVGWSALLFALACLSKPSVLPLVPLLYLLAVARYTRSAPLPSAALRATLVTAPFAVLAVASMVAAASFAAAGMRTPEEDLFGALNRPMGPVQRALRILGEFVSVGLAPVRLRLNHDVRMPGLPGIALLGAGVAGVLAAVWGAWALLRRRSVAGLGVVAFVAFTTPFLQLVPFRTNTEMAERWLFLPSFGLALAGGALAARCLAGRGARAVALCVAVLAATGVGLTVRRSWEWISQERMADVEVARAPDDLGAVSFAVTGWGPKLRYADARRVAAGIGDASFRERILLLADGWQAVAEGRLHDAKRVVRTIESLGNAPRTHVAEAYLAFRAGEPFEAVRSFERAGIVGAMQQIRDQYGPKLLELERRVEDAPGDVRRLEALADLQADLRLNARAVASYRRVLELAPDRDETRYNLGMVLRRMEQFAEASGAFRAVADRLPEAWNDVAVCESSLGREGEAEQAFLKAVSATPRDWRPPFNLALLYLNLRRPQDARAMFQTAKQRAAASGLPLSSIDEQLRRLGP